MEKGKGKERKIMKGKEREEVKGNCKGKESYGR